MTIASHLPLCIARSDVKTLMFGSCSFAHSSLSGLISATAVSSSSGSFPSINERMCEEPMLPTPIMPKVIFLDIIRSPLLLIKHAEFKVAVIIPQGFFSFNKKRRIKRIFGAMKAHLERIHNISCLNIYFRYGKMEILFLVLQAYCKNLLLI